MAIPKEPRQKMINIMYLVLTALLALNVSSEILNAFKTVDNSLQASSKNISDANATIYNSLTEKMNDPKSAAQAAVWKPKADQAKKLSDDMYSYIQGLKDDLIKESGGHLADGKMTFKEDDLHASSRMFITNKKGEELKNKIEAYKTAMFNIDPEIKKEFEKTLAIDAKPVIGADGKEKPFDVGYFFQNPTIASITLLSKFQNNVRNSENQVVAYAHSKIGEVKVRYDKFAALVGASSTYLMPGQEMTVTAGVGAYSSAANPVISIGGANVPAVNGQGTYKFQVNGAGAKSIPVSIRYKDQNGADQVVQSKIDYVVGTPGGSAVMLDKMNVFYIGVDNPVTIGSSTGWDKTTVSMSGGSISGNGSNRIVRVSALGGASITVNADGKSSKFDFRVKKIPDPVFKIADGKPRIATVAFKNQQFCRAELENFDFDVKYNVVSANVYFSGAGFPNVVQGQISGNSLAPISGQLQRCQPGSVVTFDNIKVSGPDGQRTIDGRSFALY